LTTLYTIPYLLVELVDEDKVESYEGIEVGMRVNSEWDSSHAYRSAKTYGCMGPNAVCHSDEG
jgi:hypothetical protein